MSTVFSGNKRIGLTVPILSERPVHVRLKALIVHGFLPFTVNLYPNATVK